METAIFYLLSVIVMGPALLVVTVKNVFHSALWLILSLVGVAGLYAMMAADFLFAVQLMVYAGGIMVLLLFVVLLSGKPSDWEGKQINEQWWAAGLFSFFFVALLVTLLFQWPLVSHPGNPNATTGDLGHLLLGEMLLPFEVIALVLIVALVGAVYFSSKRTS